MVTQFTLHRLEEMSTDLNLAEVLAVEVMSEAICLAVMSSHMDDRVFLACYLSKNA